LLGVRTRLHLNSISPPTGGEKHSPAGGCGQGGFVLIYTISRLITDACQPCPPATNTIGRMQIESGKPERRHRNNQFIKPFQSFQKQK
jgi:hypothetical protein